VLSAGIQQMECLLDCGEWSREGFIPPEFFDRNLRAPTQLILGTYDAIRPNCRIRDSQNICARIPGRIGMPPRYPEHPQRRYQNGWNLHQEPTRYDGPYPVHHEANSTTFITSPEWYGKVNTDIKNSWDMDEGKWRADAEPYEMVSRSKEKS